MKCCFGHCTSPDPIGHGFGLMVRKHLRLSKEDRGPRTHFRFPELGTLSKSIGSKLKITPSGERRAETQQCLENKGLFSTKASFFLLESSKMKGGACVQTVCCVSRPIGKEKPAAFVFAIQLSVHVIS